MSGLVDLVNANTQRGVHGLLDAVNEIVDDGHLSRYIKDLMLDRVPDGIDEPMAYIHPNGFTKIRLAAPPGRNWAIRIHRWDLPFDQGDVHNHRWDFVSRVISGRIHEGQYYETVAPAGDWRRRTCSRDSRGDYILGVDEACELEQIEIDSYEMGDSYIRKHERLHHISTDSGHPTVTIMIQSQPRTEATTVITHRSRHLVRQRTVTELKRHEIIDHLNLVTRLLMDG
jgi:hypothetical protein